MKKQMKRSEKRKAVDDFVNRTNLYASPPIEVGVDIRKYAAYVQENNLSGRDVTPDIISRFAL